ncbi:hypothetical protein E3N88_31439 [Mikania micrantha]|uniref:non-specific serine/threonine protein kinase n=1 Tax=Mikania micrantha TaxID=192012 RepID=A0A5N6LF96_9ASTR|nr:hypothetical protein E3N88_44101 [Mikania micrantha]KAD3642215.1 hypothetical protein E3N88_31439 [Mikania micrantha]
MKSVDEKGVESWHVVKSKVNKKNNHKKCDEIGLDGEDETTTGCWKRWKLIGSCVSSRSKVDTSISGISTHTESKSTNDTSKDQQVVQAVSSTTTSTGESNSSTQKLEDELKVASRLRKFAFNDLKMATRNFRPESLLGEGGFGCVFKGWIEENGTAPVKPGTGLTVAVKTLNHDGLQGHKEWLAEVNYLGDLIHPNLVKLIGYCIEDDQRLLAYEFMPRGSLENHLFRRSLPLPWSIRMKIALGAAKGLAFLHEEAKRPVIYRDFKTSNILLDAEYNAKLSDFGLAKDAPEGDKTHVSTRVMGTYGYAAPEYVMTGERRKFYKLIDPRLEGHFSVKGAQKAAQLASHCLRRDPKVRPLMSEVVESLKPLPALKDMASSTFYLQTIQSERVGSSPNGQNGVAVLNGSLSRNRSQHPRSLSMSSSTRASPFHQQSTQNSPKPE